MATNLNWKKVTMAVMLFVTIILLHTVVFADEGERQNGEYEITDDGTLIYHAGWYGDGYGDMKIGRAHV